jgi:hypothetical protein
MYFLSFLTLALALDSNILGDLSVSGTFSCSSLSASTLSSSGQVTTSSSLTSTDISTNNLKVSELTLTTIYPKDSIITIDSDLIIYPPVSSTAFFQVNWQILTHNSFKQSQEGWTGDLSTCNSNTFIQGYLNYSVTKEFKVPTSSKIRITANVHFIDEWNGESVQLKVNNQLMWSFQATSGDINVCGGVHPDGGYAIPVDISLAYTNLLKVEFLSEIQKEKGRFGVDNIIIYLK